MIGWQIIGEEQLEKINRVEMLDGVDSVKVKITKTLLTSEDIATFCGEDKTVNFPIIPGRMAIGQVTEVGQNDGYLVQNGSRVYLAPITNCKTCYHCANDQPDECYNFSIAGKNSDGFLKDFAVLPNYRIHPLPNSVKDEDAIYIEYISLAISVIDKLEIKKGQHVAIIGGNVLGSILAQLIIYYQGVPILIDNDDTNLLLAKKSGIYYTVRANETTEKEVSTLTGGRMVSKVVFIARSGLPTDLAFKLSAPNAKVGFVGFSYPNIKVSFSLAMKKQLTSVCITNGYGNIEPSINILANKAVDLSNYRLAETKMEDVESSITKMAENYKNNEPVSNILINMLG